MEENMRGAQLGIHSHYLNQKTFFLHRHAFCNQVFRYVSSRFEVFLVIFDDMDLDLDLIAIFLVAFFRVPPSFDRRNNDDDTLSTDLNSSFWSSSLQVAMCSKSINLYCGVSPRHKTTLPMCKSLWQYPFE